MQSVARVKQNILVGLQQLAKIHNCSPLTQLGISVSSLTVISLSLTEYQLSKSCYYHILANFAVSVPTVTPKLPLSLSHLLLTLNLITLTLSIKWCIHWLLCRLIGRRPTIVYIVYVLVVTIGRTTAVVISGIHWLHVCRPVGRSVWRSIVRTVLHLSITITRHASWIWMWSRSGWTGWIHMDMDLRQSPHTWSMADPPWNLTETRYELLARYFVDKTHVTLRKKSERIYTTLKRWPSTAVKRSLPVLPLSNLDECNE